MRGDADARRLERARSGLAELSFHWDASLRQGTQQAIWTNARRRLALVDPSLAQLPSAVPARVEVHSLLDWLRAGVTARLDTQLRQSGVCRLPVHKLHVSGGRKLSTSSGRLCLTLLHASLRLRTSGNPSSGTIAGHPPVAMLMMLRMLACRRWICVRWPSWTCWP